MKLKLIPLLFALPWSLLASPITAIPLTGVYLVEFVADGDRHDTIVDNILVSSHGTISLTPGIPEPATWSFMALGLGALLWRRRRA